MVRRCATASPTAPSPISPRTFGRSLRWPMVCARSAFRLRKSTPPISDHGLLLLEDFGSEPFVTGSPPAPIAARYGEAADLLAALHAKQVGAMLPLPDGTTYAIPAYDNNAFLIEAELLLDWYIPHRGLAVDDFARDQFRQLWLAALTPAIAGQQTWVLRDFHSPNLIWLPDRDGYRARRPARFPGCRDRSRPPTTSPRCCRTRGSMFRSRWSTTCSRAMSPAHRNRPGLRSCRFRRALRHHGGPALHQNSRHFRASR